MDPDEALRRLNGDFTLLKSVLHGVGSHDHKELSAILADLVSASSPKQLASSEAPPPDDGFVGSPRAACDFMALCTTLELDRALVQQRNPHMFMRGNSVVPLLMDALGQRSIVPLLLRARQSSSGARHAADTIRQAGSANDGGGGIAPRSASHGDPATPLPSADNVDDLLCKLVVISGCHDGSDRPSTEQQGSIPTSSATSATGDNGAATPTRLPIADAIDRLLELDRRTDDLGARASGMEGVLTDSVATLDGFVNSMWDVVESTIPQWPLYLRWGLCAVATYANQQQAVPVEVHSMLASVVVLRIVAPLLMQYPSCRHPTLMHRDDLFDADAVAARRRITFLTKLLQKAAYQQPLMQPPSPPLATSNHTTPGNATPTTPTPVRGTDGPDEGLVRRASPCPSPCPPPSTRSSGSTTISASVVVNRVVDRLSHRMGSFWALLCDPVTILRHIAEAEANAAQVQYMGRSSSMMNSYQDPVVGSAQTMRTAPMTTPRLDRTANDTATIATPPSSTMAAAFSATAGLWQPNSSPSWGGGCGGASPVSGSPFRKDQLSHEVLALYEFVDRHTTSILSHMNVQAPLSSSIHLFRLLNFSHYCHRRLSTRLAGASATTPLSTTMSTAPHSKSDGGTRSKSNSFSMLASTSLRALRDRFGRGGGRSETGAKQQSPEGKASNADCAALADDADNVFKRAMFEELVTHSARCRLQPETLNYSQLFGLLLGNVENLSILKIRQDAEEADLLRPSTSGDSSRPPSVGAAHDNGDDAPPEALATALLVLYGDQLTEATQQFALQRDRNAAVLQKSLPQTTRYCSKHCASTLHGGALDAAAYLCYLLDVVNRSYRATRYVQVLFFPPQEPLKCGCGKEWMKAIFHHIVPRHIAAMVSQIVFAQPPHGGSSVASGGGGGTGAVSSARSIFSSGHATSSPPPLFGSDSSVVVASLGATGHHPVAVKVSGVKVQTVADALEHVALGKTALEGGGNGATPAQLLAEKLGSTPFVRQCKIPLTLRDWSILCLETKQTAATGSASPIVSLRSRRNSAIKQRAATPTSNIPSGRSLPPYGDGGTFPDVPDADWNAGDDQPPVPSLPASGEEALRDMYGQIWTLETQRCVLELIWSVSASPNEDDVMAVAVPFAALVPFRRKAFEWFVTFHRGLVENLVTRQSTTSRRVAQPPSSNLDATATMQSPSGSSRTLRRGLSSSSLASTCQSPAGAHATASCPPDAVASHAHMQRTGANHCTWFGFLTEKLHPNDMAEFEAHYYRALCTTVGGGGAPLDAANGGMAPNVTVGGLPADGASGTLTAESSWMLVDEPSDNAGWCPPPPNTLQRMCALSLGHVSIRSLWRMLMYSMSCTASVLLYSPQQRGSHSTGNAAATGLPDEGTRTLWEAWRCAQQRRMGGEKREQPTDPEATDRTIRGTGFDENALHREGDEQQQPEGEDEMAATVATEETGTSAVLSAFSSLLNRSSTFRPLHSGLSATLLPCPSTDLPSRDDTALVALQQLATDLVDITRKRGASEWSMLKTLLYSTLFLRHTCLPSMASGAASSTLQSTTSQSVDASGDLDAQLARGLERMFTTFAPQDASIGGGGMDRDGGRNDPCMTDVCLALALFGVDALQHRTGSNPAASETHIAHRVQQQHGQSWPPAGVAPFTEVGGGSANAQQWLSGMPADVAAVLVPPPTIDAQLWYPC